MKKISNPLVLVAALLCVLLTVVLIFSEAFVAEHNCTDEHCVVCALAASIKFVFALAVCATIHVTYMHVLPRYECNGSAHQTPVSSKEKLTI